MNAELGNSENHALEKTVSLNKKDTTEKKRIEINEDFKITVQKTANDFKIDTILKKNKNHSIFNVKKLISLQNSNLPSENLIKNEKIKFEKDKNIFIDTFQEKNSGLILGKEKEEKMFKTQVLEPKLKSYDHLKEKKKTSLIKISSEGSINRTDSIMDDF